jgi:hypothetical protein
MRTEETALQHPNSAKRSTTCPGMRRGRGFEVSGMMAGRDTSDQFELVTLEFDRDGPLNQFNGNYQAVAVGLVDDSFHSVETAAADAHALSSF